MILASTIVGIAGIAWLSTLLAGREAKVELPPIPPRAETGMQNPRVAGVHAFADAIATSDASSLDEHCDYPELFQHLKMAGDYISTDPSEIRTLLLQGEQSRWFRQFEVTAAEIENLDQQMATSDRGEVMLHLSPDTEHGDEFLGSMEIAVRFEMAGGFARVQGWEIRSMPLRTHRRTDAGFLPEIGPSRTVTVWEKGAATEVAIATAKPLEHLATTPAKLRQEIDTQIQALFDLDASAGSFTKAWRDLVEIGKPAVPRLLNALYITPLDSQEHLMQVRRVMVALEKMTGLHYTFDQAAHSAHPFEGITQRTRQLAVKSWYGWWTNNFDRPVDSALAAARMAEQADDEADKQSRGLRPKRR